MSDQSRSRPSFLIIVVDDMGFSDLQPFGGEIPTPVLQGLAERGARFRKFHTSSLCAPEPGHASLGLRQPPGRDGGDAADACDEPVHAARIRGLSQPHSVPTMAELLVGNGYHTYLAGKWHVGITDDTCPAARGFERSVGLTQRPQVWCRP